MLHGVAPPYLQEFCVPVNFKDVLDCGRHRPVKIADDGGPAQLRLPRAHSVEQSIISTAWQKPVTEHVSPATEDSSVWTVTNATLRPCGVSLRVYKCNDLLPYLFTYLLSARRTSNRVGLRNIRVWTNAPPPGQVPPRTRALPDKRLPPGWLALSHICALTC